MLRSINIRDEMGKRWMKNVPWKKTIRLVGIVLQKDAGEACSVLGKALVAGEEKVTVVETGKDEMK